MSRYFERQRVPVTSHSAFLELLTLSLLQKLRDVVCCPWFEEAQEECLNRLPNPSGLLSLTFSFSLVHFYCVSFSFRVGRYNADLMMSLFLKDCCWFPFSYRSKDKVILAPGLHSPTPDSFQFCPATSSGTALPHRHRLTPLHFHCPVLRFMEVPLPSTTISVY